MVILKVIEMVEPVYYSRGTSKQVSVKGYVKPPGLAWEIRAFGPKIGHSDIKIVDVSVDCCAGALASLIKASNYHTTPQKHPNRTSYSKDSEQALNQRRRLIRERNRKVIHG
jgi:hypothetical protein